MSHTAASLVSAMESSTRRCCWAIQPAPTMPTRIAFTPRSAPGERGMAHRVQLARSVPAEPERGQQLLVLPEEFPGDQGSDADHLEPVIGIGDHVGVLTENVEDGKAVRGEGADSAGRLVPVEMPLSLKPLMAVSQSRGPHPDEVVGHRELGALRPVRVD